MTRQLTDEDFCELSGGISYTDAKIAIYQAARSVRDMSYDRATDTFSISIEQARAEALAGYEAVMDDRKLLAVSAPDGYLKRLFENAKTDLIAAGFDVEFIIPASSHIEQENGETTGPGQTP